MTAALVVLPAESGPSEDDVDRIMTRLDELAGEIAAVRAEAASIAAALAKYAGESEAKISVFWAQTWPMLERQVQDHEKRVRDLERRVWVASGAAALLGAAVSKLLAG